MTDAKRRAIIQLIKRHTAANTISPERARSSLINEGIYTSAGAIKAEFGGEPVKAKAKA